MKLTFLRKAWKESSCVKRFLLALLALTITLCVPASTMMPRPNGFYVDLTVEGWKNEESLSYEVWISSIQLGNQIVNLADILLENGWAYSETRNALWNVACDGQESGTLRIGPFQEDKICFSFDSHQWCGVLRIGTAAQTVVEDLYSTESLQKDLLVENDTSAICWQNASTLNYLTVIVGYAAIFLLSYAMLMLVPLKEKTLLTVGYLSVSIVLWLTSEYIEPSRSTLLILGVLTGSACYSLNTSERSDTARTYYSSRLMWLVFLVSLYASFASFGYRLFLEGDFVSFGRVRTIYFLLGIFWFCPVIMFFLRMLEKIGKMVARDTLGGEKRSRAVVWALSSIVALACLSISFVGFYPGCFPLDAVVQLEQAQTTIYTNWHPIVHTLLMKAVYDLFGNASAVIFVQLFVFSLLVGRIAVIAYDCGVSLRTNLCAVAVFALLPNQAVTNVSPLKDFAFSYTLVWGVTLLFEMTMNPKAIRRLSFQIQTILCMYLMKELRHNGIVPLVFFACALGIIGVKNREKIKWRVVASIMTAIVAIVLTDGPLMSMLNVAKNPISPYVTMFCGVGSCLNKDKTFSDETMERLQDVMSLDNWKNYYGRFVGHDNYLWGGGENRMDLSTFSAGEAFKIYFEALSDYPDIVIKDRLDGMNIMWDITQPNDDGNFNARIFDMVVANEKVGLNQAGVEEGANYYVHNPIADFYRKWTYFTFPGERAEDQVTDMLLWRSGAYILFFLMLAIYWSKNHLQKMWLVAMPMLGNIFAMMLVLYHQSFRYIYFIQLCVITLTLMTFCLQRKQTDHSAVREEN